MVKKRRISVFFGLQPNQTNYEDTDIIVVDKDGLNHLPGGKGEEGETIEQTGMRELGEELKGWNKKTIQSAFSYHSHQVNVLNVDSIPDEWEQHFISAYVDFAELKPGDNEVKEIRNISVLELVKDWRKNTFAMNAYLLLCWRNMIMQYANKKDWSKYESDVKKGVDPYNVKDKDKYVIIMIGGLKSSGKSKLYEELNNELGRSKYDHKLVLIEEDLISFYEDGKYICPEDIIRLLSEQANCIIIGNQHHKYATHSMFIKDTYESWLTKMRHRLSHGRVNSESASVKDSELVNMKQQSFNLYYKEKKSKVGHPVEMEYDKIKEFVLSQYKQLNLI